MNNSKGRVTPLVIFLAVVLMLLCTLVCCAVLITAVLLPWYSQSSAGPTIIETLPPTNTPRVIRPTVQATSPLPPLPTPGEPEGNASETQQPTSLQDTLAILENTQVPINDLYDIARRLEGKKDVPTTLPAPTVPFQLGEQQAFWVSNTDTNENFQVEATLRYITPHAYFWIEDGVSYRQRDLKNLAEAFEEKIYPTDRAFFGSEWTPGVDGDVHLYILYARNLGENLAGYFSSADSYNPLVRPYSNGHEMFVFNADNVDLGDEYAYGVLAHEFQHMIHWYRDRNESSWLNEGFSDLAMFLNGYDVGGQDYLFAQDADLQLNDWPNDPSQTGPHYGAAFLFVTYFLDRFGEKATQALVAEPDNGMDSLDKVLSQLGAKDPLTHQPVRADDVFMDWVLATHLENKNIADGRYAYHIYPAAPKTPVTETIRDCNSAMRTRDVHQYGADFIRITCRGNFTLNFEGSTQVAVLPTDPRSGKYAFWSNKGDESDMTLTRSFDFSAVSGPITFSYWTWYDLEKDYDYLYLEASSDGENWQILHTPSGTASNPSGNNYGWGYNGESGGGPAWIQENVDLSSFAGRKVQLRFEYITDAAVNGEGFLLDDMSIPQINYDCDFEADTCGWEPNGWVRIDNVLPQTFRLALIQADGTTTIKNIPLSPDNSAQVPLSLSSGEEATLVVTGTTRFTRQEATYRFNFLP